MAGTAAQKQPLTLIKLSGSLAQKFGRTHRRHIDSGQTWEVFKALKATLEGFETEIRRLDRLGMRFAIFRNRRNVGIDDLGRRGTQEVRIVPVVEGSKRGGILQTVLAAVLIVVGVVTQQYWLVQTGVALAIGGVIQMLSPQAKGLSQSAAPENLPSYAFGSAKNTTASGNPVPICIGERRWGGAIISASIEAQDKA
ncbi:TPA: tail assembly protein [Pseudomonas putida]|uniref:tail assembly protein n=1 Tax=Pseudomonas TaxID=286 RepID=UPI000E0CDC14|nr:MULTISPECIES: tail assembly protein [Pseudomonas]ELU0814232.1 tail assembly protein [Pseudomonas putida]MBH3388712.1 tail assembly protein [Pseudomonas putida]MBS5849193.1 tail assembly protein [Pseudomonas putida]MDD2119539.1 tail assembly protein [Pseudomonas putida]UPU90435.1 tail assembly protein [Pseudomonas putida]